MHGMQQSQQSQFPPSLTDEESNTLKKTKSKTNATTEGV